LNFTLELAHNTERSFLHFLYNHTAQARFGLLLYHDPRLPGGAKNQLEKYIGCIQRIVFDSW
jgi:hypothetical protein